jgi:hypothetical protein
VLVVATPDLGWVFDHWEGDVGGTGNVILVTMLPTDPTDPETGNKFVKAVFRKFPVITAVSPDRGSIFGDEAVTILGLQLTTASAVQFGSKEASIVSISDGALSVTTPKGTPAKPNPRGAVDVTVWTAFGTATRLAGFTFLEPPPAPEVGSLTPSQGSVLGGDIVLIRGRNLALVQAVSFGGTPALIGASEDTRVHVTTLPHDPGPVDVQVTTSSGTATLQDGFTYVVAPRILALSPNQGVIAGGETVKVSGTGLADPTAVTFGNVAATINASSDTEIKVTTPPNPPGSVDVSVTTLGGTVALLDGFNYFDGAASLACTVLEEAAHAPVLDATVRLEPTGRAVTENDHGVYRLINIRPDQYILMVSAPTFATQFKVITLHRDEHAAITVLLRPALGGATNCGPAFKRLDEKIAETAIPLSVQESAPGAGGVLPGGTLAIRLSTTEPVDPASVWAIVEAHNGAFASDGVWRAAVAGDDRDGWVVFTPKSPLPAGEVVTMSVGAVTAGGTILEPISADFLVLSGNESPAAEPLLNEEPGTAPLPDLLAAPKSAVYRIVPAGVYAQPVAIQIPVPSGTNPEDLEVYYYSESVAHMGWYRGGNVAGWLAPDGRRTVTVDGQACLEIQVNHSGVVQVGQAVKLRLGSATPIEVGVTGSRTWWLSLGSILLALSVVLGRSVARGKKA